jgi:hypothetical protein
MKTVAESPVLDQAIAELSGDAHRLLSAIHDGTAREPHAAAAHLIARLREITRCTGVDLNDVPAYRHSTTNWRAVARLAATGVGTQPTAQAG